jgi:endonuclease/exonuclease/phosphatase family metal-dependent hydrolase
MKSLAGETPVILTGDFNSFETDAPYLAMIDTSSTYHVTDAITISQIPHHGPMATFAGNFQISGMIDHRIDYIFVRNKIDVLRHGILSDSWNGNLASDHLPVLAEIKIK